MVVTVCGRARRHVQPAVRRLPCPRPAATSDRVILDLSGVDFMDTTALAVIVGHWRRQVEAGGMFLLAGARYRYTKALWITGLADRLPMYDTVDEALTAARA